MERRLGNDPAMMRHPMTPRGSRKYLKYPMAAVLTALVAVGPASAQYFGDRPIRYGNTSSWFYDGRDDNRDFPTDGFFPGNFAANPFDATIGGASGFLGSNPRRSATPYPSQTYFGFARERIDCRDVRFHAGLKYQTCGHHPQRPRSR